MIFDKIENLKLYKDIPSLTTLVDYIGSHDLNELPDGRTDIDGDFEKRFRRKKVERALQKSHSDWRKF